MADDSGATPRELLIEACRRNNTSLLSELLASKSLSSNAASIAKFLNTTTDALGASALHIAAQYGSYEVLDIILDQEGVEIDHQEKRDGDTPLHKSVRYSNEQSRSDREHGKAVVDILVDAGCDPRWVKEVKLLSHYVANDAQDTEQGQTTAYRSCRPTEHGSQKYAAES